MSNNIEHSGYEESVLYSNDDYEPYGYVSPQLLSVAATGFASAQIRSHERVIEAMLLQQLEM